MNIEIAEMNQTHIDRVLDIEERCFSVPWSRADFVREMTVNSFAHYFIAVVNDEIVGYGGLWHVVTEGHITNIAVLPQYRRHGIGQKLLSTLMGLAKEKEMHGITLEVRISNTAAQKLYTKNGFKPEGFRKRYYSDTGEDAIIMWHYF